MRRYRQGIWIAGIWLAIALVNATQGVVSLRGEGISRPLGYYFAFTTLTWAIWACSTPLVLWMTRRFPPTHRLWPRGWLAHLGLCLAIAVASAAWGNGLSLAIRPFGRSDDTRSFAALVFGRTLNQLHVSLISYAAVVAIAHTLESRRRAAELRVQLSQAQLDALWRQLEPHFLFNTLNAIAGLVRDRRNDDAVSMIAGLSDLLRRVGEGADRQQVPLGEEVEFLERYLDIQRARFSDRLRVRIDVPAELRAAQVPSLILQPLVENAIQHGIGRRVEGGEVRVVAARTDADLTIRISNEGPPLAASWKPGIGVSNSRARLASLYGGDSRLSIHNCNGGVEAVVTVPYRTCSQ